MNDSVFVNEIYQIDDQTLGIAWTDRKISRLNVIMLREKCPCAECKKVSKKSIDFSQVRPKSISSVGRYALGVEFSDGHKTGIYSFELLRSLSV